VFLKPTASVPSTVQPESVPEVGVPRGRCSKNRGYEAKVGEEIKSIAVTTSVPLL
jgi:hypothetical protein